MSLFRKKQTPIVIPPHQPVVVSIEPHETARKEAFDEAREVNKKLNNLLVENGFTLKLWVATGGAHKTVEKDKK